MVTWGRFMKLIEIECATLDAKEREKKVHRIVRHGFFYDNNHNISEYWWFGLDELFSSMELLKSDQRGPIKPGKSPVRWSHIHHIPKFWDFSIIFPSYISIIYFHHISIIFPSSSSMDWFKGKSTGNHRFSREIWGFPVNFPLNQSIDFNLVRTYPTSFQLSIPARTGIPFIHVSMQWWRWWVTSWHLGTRWVTVFGSGLWHVVNGCRWDVTWWTICWK